MDHEKRIKVLEEEIAQLKQILKELSPKNKWLSISDTCKQFDVTRPVLLNRIHSGLLVHLKDYKKNGKRYLINIDSLKKIM